MLVQTAVEVDRGSVLHGEPREDSEVSRATAAASGSERDCNARAPLQTTVCSCLVAPEQRAQPLVRPHGEALLIPATCSMMVSAGSRHQSNSAAGTTHSRTIEMHRGPRDQRQTLPHRSPVPRTAERRSCSNLSAIHCIATPRSPPTRQPIRFPWSK